MATLHVRNVPDELYELLREHAAAQDRSIGAETIQLLHERLAADGWPRQPRRLAMPGRRRSSGSGLFTRFSAEARQVVVEAQEQARELAHDHVGPEHLLLGVLRGGESSPAARVLHRLGLTSERARREVEARLGRGDTRPTGQIPFRPAAKQALEAALHEALSLEEDVVAPEHILLGIVADEAGAAAEIIRAVEPDVSELRRATEQARLDAAPPDAAARTTFRVVQLEGSADAWEAQLNEAAKQGYELAEIVERRAILHRE
jgi:ATP-dependent Clp protease ATP-binding subunit ClpA